MIENTIIFESTSIYVWLLQVDLNLSSFLFNYLTSSSLKSTHSITISTSFNFLIYLFNFENFFEIMLINNPIILLLNKYFLVTFFSRNIINSRGSFFCNLSSLLCSATYKTYKTIYNNKLLNSRKF